jgi:hypothetical protein
MDVRYFCSTCSLLLCYVCLPLFGVALYYPLLKILFPVSCLLSDCGRLMLQLIDTDVYCLCYVCYLFVSRFLVPRLFPVCDMLIFDFFFKRPKNNQTHHKVVPIASLVRSVCDRYVNRSWHDLSGCFCCLIVFVICLLTVGDRFAR